MPTVSDAARVRIPPGAVWRWCVGCGGLFPAAPDADRCVDCEASCGGARCAAARRDDRSPCEGRVEAVRLVDGTGDSVTGCVHHAALLLAAVLGVVAEPLVPGAACEAVSRASRLRAGGRL